MFMRLGTEWDGFQVAPDELVGDGGSIVALGHLSGTYKATGKSFLAPFAHAWKFRDGRAVSSIQYTDTLPMPAGTPMRRNDRIRCRFGRAWGCCAPDLVQRVRHLNGDFEVQGTSATIPVSQATHPDH